MKSRPEEERSASSGGRRIAPLIPPILLCLVAVTQVWLTRSVGLTPWRGGGFGMFSTPDSEYGRLLRIRIGAGEGEPIPLPEGAIEAARVAKAFPSRGRLEALGERVLNLARAEGRDVRQVSIQILRLHYDEKTMAPRYEVVGERVVEAP